MIRVLAVTGKMGSGKTTVTDLIKAKVNIPVVTLKFADPLYEMQTAIYKIANRPIPQPKDRKLLQWLGTDWGRSIDSQLWVKIWQERVDFYLNSNAQSLVLNDDCRFDNEAELIKSMGGKIVQIEADTLIRATRIPLVETGHASEAGVSAQLIDYKIKNDRALSDLSAQVNCLLQTHDIPFSASGNKTQWTPGAV